MIDKYCDNLEKLADAAERLWQQNYAQQSATKATGDRFLKVRSAQPGEGDFSLPSNINRY